MLVGVGVEGCFWTGEGWFECDFLKKKRWVMVGIVVL